MRIRKAGRSTRHGNDLLRNKLLNLNGGGGATAFTSPLSFEGSALADRPASLSTQSDHDRDLRPAANILVPIFSPLKNPNHGNRAPTVPVVFGGSMLNTQHGRAESSVQPPSDGGPGNEVLSRPPLPSPRVPPLAMAQVATETVAAPNPAHLMKVPLQTHISPHTSDPLSMFARIGFGFGGLDAVAAGTAFPPGDEHQGPSPIDYDLELDAEFLSEMVAELQERAARKVRRMVLGRTLGGRPTIK
ncbi:unnamed protein product, partial [Sphagnum compactum]